MKTQQTIDTGISRETLERQLVDFGYWNTPERRRRNAYVLSPSVYALSARQYSQLKRLSACAYEALADLSKRLSALARRKALTNGEASFLKLATSHRSGLCSPLEVRGAVPPAIKVDLVQDQCGDFRIAEIDAYNPRGFAYLGLLDATIPEGFQSPGKGVGELARLMHAVAVSPAQTWAFVVAEHEHYYLPSFEILAGLLAQYGVRSAVVREKGISVKSLIETCGGDAVHIFCVPQSFGNAEVRQRLLQGRLLGAVRTFYPPAAYLGSKAFLPFLSQCPGMGEFVPRTFLVNQKRDPRGELNGRPAVLKGVMSSGMKQIAFSDINPEGFNGAYANARSMKRTLYVLQEKVVQRPERVVVFDEAGGRVLREYFLRITAYVTAEGLMGAEVTGRPDELVHGAPDCIQIPAVLGE